MKTQDLSNNKERIIKNIRKQITGCTKQNIIDVMNKMVCMLPNYEGMKPLMKNIDDLTHKSTISYIKYGITFTRDQKTMLEIQVEQDKLDSLPSSMRLN